ncbi:MAG: response regulator [Deltaproteobacteria bacterium]|nr:response regulator [Deltaproteobacteria bacterium]
MSPKDEDRGPIGERARASATSPRSEHVGEIDPDPTPPLDNASPPDVHPLTVAALLDQLTSVEIAAHAAGKAVAILVVDDDDGIRQGLTRRLLRQGHQVFEANNSKDALRLLERNTVDLIFLDVMMPGDSGLEILPAIQEMNPRPKCVLMSGKASLLEKAAIRGADWVLSKPFSQTHLLAALEILYADPTPAR